jgi:hypothetical protein
LAANFFFLIYHKHIKFKKSGLNFFFSFVFPQHHPNSTYGHIAHLHQLHSGSAVQQQSLLPLPWRSASHFQQFFYFCSVNINFITNTNVCWGCIVFSGQILFLSFCLSVCLLSDFSQTRPYNFISISFCRHLEHFQVRIEFSFQYFSTSCIGMRRFLEL